MTLQKKNVILGESPCRLDLGAVCIFLYFLWLIFRRTPSTAVEGIYILRLSEPVM